MKVEITMGGGYDNVPNEWGPASPLFHLVLCQPTVFIKGGRCVARCHGDRLLWQRQHSCIVGGNGKGQGLC